MHNYFLIPGNPPARYFYQLWAEEILLLEPSSQLRIAHYPDLDKTKDSRVAMQLMQNHLMEQFKNFRQTTADSITLMGHSLGGHFALKLLEELNEDIKKVILIHPFLRRPNQQGRLILRTVSSLYHREKIQNVIIKKRHWLELISDELVPVTNQELNKTFHIARHEARTIAKDRSAVTIPHSLRDKILAFYHPHDNWCTENVINDLKAQVYSVECREPHGFITTKTHRESLFDKIKVHLNE